MVVDGCHGNHGLLPEHERQTSGLFFAFPGTDIAIVAVAVAVGGTPDRSDAPGVRETGP